MSVKVIMPRAGLTMIEGTISEWKVKEGSTVKKGDVIMEYENEKNTIEYEALDKGILHIIAQPGDTIAVGGLIGILAETPEEYKQIANSSADSVEGPEVAKDAGAAAAAAVENKPASSSNESKISAAKRDDGHVSATGLARKMAKEAGIDIGDVPPSGGKGTRIVAKDVEAYIAAGGNAAAPLASGVTEEDVITRVPWTGIKKTIANNMYNSLQNSAQCTAALEVDVTDLLSLRRKLVEQKDFLGCKITVNDLLCMAVIKMLKKHPTLNATFDGSVLSEHKHVNLSVAVATENGLMVPVVKHADSLSLVELSLRIKDLSERAKAKKLVSGEQGCGSFTVSNVGMYPMDLSTPIINPPEVGLLGFGRSTKKPVYIDGEFVARDTMWAYLTFDHRVIDGMEAGEVFKDLKVFLENPGLICA